MQNARVSFLCQWAEQDDRVRSVAFSGERVNKAAVLYPSDPYCLTFGVTKPESFVQETDWEQVFQTALLQKDSVGGEPLQIRLLFDDLTRIDISIVSSEEMAGLIERDTLMRIRFDKDGILNVETQPTDLSHRTARPTPEQYRLWCATFFKEVTDVALSLQEGELLPAQRALDRARKPLIKMTEAAVASTAEYHLNFGPDDRNLKAYMDAKEYDHLMRSYAFSDIDRIWDALFQSCMLFRRAGLRLDETGDFTYPRKMDVSIMQHFRTLWEESR
ncbi:MAG: aminoglycoside 6-adenylyltransferase [Peptoniphilaceae bacterium]|nr:aminoglycoside 6-adenylyltransferase [Peptoniphilaceae bacterium]MDD7434158.1 aminoglycoside 6-adenylyltransferase [Peptoniphilaceae bacterium]MDY3075254.1 aminoglycoside 6-adenylyltransferase [Peptoniphilaceae bacterium]MDY3987080.1 aminoglycoside 6-adenylyltransferase [Peptoniphilaceae bacterium]MDY4195849.1 aminoglycoside 6-adenylyltransferase [Peptoniphilaceae bacterium]